MAEKNPQKEFVIDNVESPSHRTQNADKRYQDNVTRGYGVRKVEAITSTWSKKLLWAEFVGIFLLACQSLDSNTTGQLAAYVTSDFRSHSLLPVSTIVGSLVTACIALPLSKLLDLWGRAEGLATVALSSTLGSVMVATCQNVDTYFGKRVFKSIGTSGISYVTTVLVSDMTSLVNRTLFLGITATPFIAKTWMGPPIAQSLLRHSTWRWGYGAFAIMTPIFTLAPFAILWYIQRRVSVTAENGEHPDKHRSQSWPALSKGRSQILHWAQEFDIIGLLLLATGFSLLLLAMTLAKSNGSTWRSTHIIVMLVLGPILIVAFVLWEKVFSTRPIVSLDLMTDRTVLRASLCGTFMRAAFYMWANYFTSHLQVVQGLSVEDAGYVDKIYSIVTCLWAPFLGLIVKRLGRYKSSYKLIAFVAIPVHLLGAGLMIRYRTANSSLVAICFSQILLALGGGTLVNMEELAVMAVTTHDKIAAVLAFKALFAYLGGAIGSAVSAAIWGNMLLGKLHKYLPETSKSQAHAIYESLNVQLKYLMGSSARRAIISSYEDTQKIMTIVAIVMVAFATGFVILWKDVRLSAKKQVKGRIL